jgi:hypothetical protein
MKIDLSIGAELSSSISIKIDEIAKEIRKDFTELISIVSQGNGLANNIDWWVESPSSRNTLASPFFYYLCGIRLIERLIKENHYISEIVVDSFALKIIIRDLLFKKSVNIPVNGPNASIANKTHRIIKNLKIIFQILKNKFHMMKCSRETKFLQRPMIDGSLTLIDTFVFPGFISKDRYYNGLWENLSKDERSLTYFVPTLASIPSCDIISAYKELRKSDKNYLIKEDYLKFGDLIFSILHSFRILFLKIKRVSFLGMDISPLIKEEILIFNGFINAVEGLLNFRFAKALKNNRINLRLVINWFENQVGDKGWNAGFSLFYPGIRTIGYRGYVTSDLYLCSLPSKCENINNVLPQEIAVIGKELCDSTKEFDSTLKIKIVPAFRFSHLWENHLVIPSSKYFTIFFALPYNWVESKAILQVLFNNLDYIINNNFRIIVKPHPTMSIENVKNMIGSDYTDIFSLVDESFIDCLSKSNMVISGLSGAVIESIVLGIPVVLLRNHRGITFNPIPKEIPQGIWTMCESSDEIIGLIKKYSSNSDEQLQGYKELGKQVRKNYFEPVTKESVQKFMGFSN